MSLQQGGFASWEHDILSETILFPSLTPVRSLFRIPSGSEAKALERTRNFSTEAACAVTLSPVSVYCLQKITSYETPRP